MCQRDLVCVKRDLACVKRDLVYHYPCQHLTCTYVINMYVGTDMYICYKHVHRYDLGQVCYLAQDFKPLMQMSKLHLELVRAGGENEQVQQEAEREFEALGRNTNTWLAIFQV
jgi:hypothetical protein